MDHPCRNCGAPIEDGIPFCRQCNAPQIRVANVQTIETGSPLLSDEGLSIPPPPRPLQSSKIPWSSVFPAALVGLGLLMALGRTLSPPAAMGLAMLAAGVIAVGLCYRRNPGVILSPATGAKLGALSGLMAFGILAILSGASMAVLHSRGELQSTLIEVLDQAAARTSDPEALAMIQQFKNPHGLALVMIGSMLGALLLFVAISSIGGAITAVLLRKTFHR